MIRLIIFDGVKVGKLTVGRPVLPKDPEVSHARTPHSYLTHGSLRECLCECGGKCYVSTYMLSRQKVKSCGCNRRKVLEKKFSNDKIKYQIEQLREEMAPIMRAYKLARVSGDHEGENTLFDQIKAIRERIKAFGKEK